MGILMLSGGSAVRGTNQKSGGVVDIFDRWKIWGRATDSQFENHILIYDKEAIGRLPVQHSLSLEELTLFQVRSCVSPVLKCLPLKYQQRSAGTCRSGSSPWAHFER